MIINADCWEHIKTLKDNTIDHIVTDPPYDIGFMNKGWDKNSIVSNAEFWKECLRVLKPGGYLLAFSHSRTSHRQTCAIEDAGFEIRDTIMWLYGSGFPKSTNAAIAIDKKKKVLAHRGKRSSFNGQRTFGGEDIPKAIGMPQHQAITEEAKKWQGWGSNLKPAHEPVVMARKPLEGTIADNAEKWGTGAINIDACRIEAETKLGRFPANVIMDEEAGKILGEQSKFFYCPKVSTKERGHDNNHPTVKPIALMEYLVKLVSREGQTITTRKRMAT